MIREHQGRPFGGAQAAEKEGPNKQFSELAVDVLVPCFKGGAIIGRIVSNCLIVLPEAMMFVYDNNPSDSAEDEAAKENAWLV